MNNDSIKSAYLDMLIESVEVSQDSDDFEYDLLDEAVTGERPSDLNIKTAMLDHTVANNYRLKESNPKYENFMSSLEKAHKKTVSKVKADLSTDLGGKISVKKLNQGNAFVSMIHSDGHPVAEVRHTPAAKSDHEYGRWDTINQFHKYISPVTSDSVRLHAEHTAKLKELGSKEKVPFSNQKVYVTHMGKPETHMWGHGSQGSINIKQKALTSSIFNGVTKHTVKDTWDKYD